MPTFKEFLAESPIPRKTWKDKFESRLMGAFGEYVSGQIAEQLHLHNAWSREVQRLMDVVNSYFYKNVAFKNLRRAYNEIVEDCDPNWKVNYAKHHVAHYYPQRHIEILELEVDGPALFAEFLDKYIIFPDNV